MLFSGKPSFVTFILINKSFVVVVPALVVVVVVVVVIVIVVDVVVVVVVTSGGSQQFQHFRTLVLYMVPFERLITAI